MVGGKEVKRRLLNSERNKLIGDWAAQASGLKQYCQENFSEEFMEGSYPFMCMGLGMRITDDPVMESDDDIENLQVYIEHRAKKTPELRTYLEKALELGKRRRERYEAQADGIIRDMLSKSRLKDVI